MNGENLLSSAVDDMLLAPYRVLDLSDERGLLCGRILADLGADVLQVEPPHGSSARNIGPFYQDVPDRERSMFWWSYAANKRSITLDPSTNDGRALLLRLVGTADFLVESSLPGYMQSLGLDYDSLQAVNPGLVMVSITPFGQDGPYSQYMASDLTGVALGGLLYITGDHDRPPVQIGYPQFYLLGSCWRGHRRDAGPQPPCSNRRGAACGRILSASGGQGLESGSPELGRGRGARQADGRLPDAYGWHAA